jgi:hypothetical protein
VGTQYWGYLETGYQPFLPIYIKFSNSYFHGLFLGINHSRNTIETGTSLPESLEPDTESVFTSCYLVGKFRIEKNFEFFIRACARKGSNKPTSACPSDNSWKESCIQEGFDNPTMI